MLVVEKETTYIGVHTEIDASVIFKYAPRFNKLADESRLYF